MRGWWLEDLSPTNVGPLPPRSPRHPGRPGMQLDIPEASGGRSPSQPFPPGAHDLPTVHRCWAFAHLSLPGKALLSLEASGKPPRSSPAG